MRRGSRRVVPALLVGLGPAFFLVGCSSTDPYVRPGQWRPLGANADNLRAMVADPRDLQRGHGSLAGDGELAALAVARLRGGAVHALPNSALTDIKANDAGNTAPAPPPATGGEAGTAP